MKKETNIIKNEIAPNERFTEFILYTTADGKVKLEILIRNETVWLTQAKMAELFNVDRSVITKHIQNIYAEHELERKSTCAKNAQVQKEGRRDVSREIEFYNLDVIISVGYRVNSLQATQFRMWATQILKEYIIKGFAMDDKRLKNPKNIFGKDYFEEQLARIRDIRSSERRFYQKITDIYSQCSADYDPNTEITHEFFATVQNKLHFAISGQTASEIIYNRADSEKHNMGLTNWENGPKGSIRKSDVTVAKNYLDESELESLNRIVSMYLDYAELQAKRNKVMRMNDWIEKLNSFLKFSEYDILNNAGKVSHDIAQALALKEFEKFKVNQDKNYISDFDREINKIADARKSAKKHIK